MFSQGSVATYARNGGIFSNQLTANLPRNLSVKKLCKSVKIRQSCGLEFVASLFGPLCASTRQKDKRVRTPYAIATTFLRSNGLDLALPGGMGARVAGKI